MTVGIAGKTKRRVSGVIVGGLGVAAGTVHGYYLAQELHDALPTAVYSVVLPLCLSVLLVVAGYWLAQSDVVPRHAVRVAWCTVVGAVVLVLSGVLMIHYQQAEGVAMSDQWFVLTDTATGGGVIGFVLGMYAVRIEHQTAKLDQYRDRLERERDQFVALFDNLPNPAIQYELVDGTPVVRVVNPAFERAFGYDSEDAIGHSLEEVVVPCNEADALDVETLRSGEVRQRAVQLTAADGIRDFVRVVVPTHCDNSETTGYVIAVDVTERKQYVCRLQVLNRVLRHDLRNEANVIIGNADLLLEEWPEATRAETIRDSAYELVELGDTARKIEQTLGRDDESMKPLVLNDVLRSSAQRAQREHSSADVRTDVSDDVWVLANELLESVFDNVIENAIEHNDAETPVVTVEVHSGENGFVTVEIADNGPGFPEREQKVLQGRAETQLQHSLGLGLWFVNWVVVDSGGEVTFDDNEPRGTVVSISLRKANGPRPNRNDSGGDIYTRDAVLPR